MNRKLYVGNLPFEITDAELQAIFETAGTVSSVQIMRDGETGRARGFGFVEMATDADAVNAISNLHDSAFGGRNLSVTEARPPTARTEGFGRSRGNRRW